MEEEERTPFQEFRLQLQFSKLALPRDKIRMERRSSFHLRHGLVAINATDPFTVAFVVLMAYRTSNEHEELLNLVSRKDSLKDAQMSWTRSGRISMADMKDYVKLSDWLLSHGYDLRAWMPRR